MPEPRKPRPTPSPQGQVQAQEIDPAILEAFLEAANDPAPDEEAGLATSRMEALRLLARQFSFILIPLLFAIVTFLLTLLFFAIHRNSPPIELLAMGLIALAVAILQGMMLYYSGSNSGLWFICLLVGFVLFPPIPFFVLGSAPASLITLVVMALVCGSIVWFCKALVPDGSVGIVYSFGKYQRTLEPGANFLPPWERMKHVIDTRETQWTCPVQTIHMSPTTDLSLAATISYQVIPEEAHLAVLQVNKWEQQLHDLFRADLQSIATEFRPEDFYPWQQKPAASARSQAGDESANGATKGKAPVWSRMNTRLFQLIRDQVAPWGVEINRVSIHDVTPLPHAGIQAAAKGTAGTAPTNPSPSSRPGPSQATAPIPSRQTGAPTKPPAQPSAQPQPTAKATPPAAAPAEPTVVATNNKKFDTLINLYNEVRVGHITDPETIRRIASRFDDIAQNPAESQAFPFNAAQAARTLYARAQHYEEQISASAEFSPFNAERHDAYDEDETASTYVPDDAYDPYDPYDDEDEDEDDDILGDLSGQSGPDTLHQPPPDDDLTAGG